MVIREKLWVVLFVAMGFRVFLEFVVVNEEARYGTFDIE